MYILHTTTTRHAQTRRKDKVRLFTWVGNVHLQKRSLSQKRHTWQLPNQPASFTQLEASPAVLYARSCTNTWNTTQSVIISYYTQVHTYEILRQNCAHTVYTMRVTTVDTIRWVSNSYKWEANGRIVLYPPAPPQPLINTKQAPHNQHTSL